MKYWREGERGSKRRKMETKEWKEKPNGGDGRRGIMMIVI